MASLLATRGVENGALRSYALSALGHAVLALAVFFFSSPGKRTFIEEIPRSVKLVATLDIPAPPAPPPAPSRIKVPSKNAPPLLAPRERPAETAPSSLKDKLSDRLSGLETPPPEAPQEDLPRLAKPEIRALAVPSATAPSASLPPTEDLVPLSNFPYAWYIAIVKEKVFAGWRPPSSFSLAGRKVTTIASFRITREGSITQISIKEASGHHLFDQSVLAALDGLAALPALPKDYKEEYLDVVIRFQNPNS